MCRWVEGRASPADTPVQAKALKPEKAGRSGV